VHLLHKLTIESAFEHVCLPNLSAVTHVPRDKIELARFPLPHIVPPTEGLVFVGRRFAQENLPKAPHNKTGLFSLVIYTNLAEATPPACAYEAAG